MRTSTLPHWLLMTPLSLLTTVSLTSVTSASLPDTLMAVPVLRTTARLSVSEPRPSTWMPSAVPSPATVSSATVASLAFSAPSKKPPSGSGGARTVRPAPLPKSETPLTSATRSRYRPGSMSTRWAPELTPSWMALKASTPQVCPSLSQAGQ